MSVGASDLQGFCAKKDYPGHSLWMEATGNAHKAWLQKELTEKVLDGLTKSVTAGGRVVHHTGSEATAGSYRYKNEKTNEEYTATTVNLELTFKRPATVPSDIPRDDQTVPLQPEDEVKLCLAATSLFDKDGYLANGNCYHAMLTRKDGTAKWDAALDDEE
jgi:hypothetical protein